jgi:hypothetical protein
MPSLIQVMASSYKRVLGPQQRKNRTTLDKLDVVFHVPGFIDAADARFFDPRQPGASPGSANDVWVFHL